MSRARRMPPDGGQSRQADEALLRFAGALRRLQQESGDPSVRELVARMRTAGRPFARSTVNDKLTGVSRPSWQFVEAFVTACAQGRAVDLREWQRLYRGLLADLADTRAGARRAVQARAELGAGPGAAPAARTAPDPTGTHVVPRQLPPPPRPFSGRLAELAALTDALSADGSGSAAPVIVAIGGTAGIGKTALAVQWAHRVAELYPDGQLYVNLRGFGRGEQSMDPGEALGGFLTALGLLARRIPHGLDAQTALYRSMLSGRRMLVLLDNARSAEQVRPLLPGTPGCLVIVTSRDQLTGLLADGAHPVTLDLLSQDEARQLLSTRLGGSRLAAESDAVDDIVSRCGRLPLALAIVAGRAAAQTHLPLRALAEQLRDSRDRLDALADGDPETDIRAVFSWSYQTVSPEAARLFRLLGLHPGPDITTAAAASLAALAPRPAGQLLTHLARKCLLTQHAPDRYTLHDLLRAYASEKARESDSEPERHAAIGRMLDHYLSGAAAAAGALHPVSQFLALRPALPPPGAAGDPPATDTDARQAWLDHERANLVAVCRYAADHGWARQSVELARALTRYLDTGGHYTDAYTIHTHVSEAARGTGDRAGQALALTGLGLVYRRWGEYERSAEQLRGALGLARTIGDRATEAWALAILGSDCWGQGRLGPAAEHLRHALSLARDIDDQATEVWALTMLGAVCQSRAELEPAAGHLTHALDLCRRGGDRTTEGRALAILGLVRWRQGDPETAHEHLRRGLDLNRATGDRTGEGLTLTILGSICWRHRQLDSALGYLRGGLALSRQVGDQATEAWALTALSDVSWQRGERGPAAEQLQQALNLSRQVGDQVGEGSALTVLGIHHAHRGRPDLATETLRQSLALARQIGNRIGESDALIALGMVCRQHGAARRADEYLRQALDLCRRVGYRPGEVAALRGLAGVPDGDALQPAPT